jgi:choline dehydrogenase-like flavoprotein
VLRDFRQADSGEAFEADLCVIGAGPAGIAIARELSNTRHQVILLEGGGLEFAREAQDLYRGTNTAGGFGLHTSRFRMFGGTTYVWGGWCAPLDELDFQKRDWVSYSGWPIGMHELLPYYERAQPLCELGRYRYSVPEWPEFAAATLALDPDKLEHKLWQLSQPPTRFGESYLDALRQSPNVTLLVHANVTEIVAAENAASVQELQIASLDGRRGRVRARAYVLACGGIETPRLMLASNRVEQAGLGNGHDLVGRFFMEHPHPDAGGVLLSADAEALRPYFDAPTGEERVVLGLGPSERAQRRLGILNCSLAIRGPLHFEPSEGWDSLIKLSRAFGDRRWPDSAGKHMLNVLRDLDDVLREGYRRSRSGPVQGFAFLARSECAPNPANRVTLSEERDALGLNRPRLDWSVGTQDRVTVERSMMLLAEELGRLEIGRVRINELLLTEGPQWIENLSWFGHHMGTTRMSENPRSGVVDPDCRVHGIANLYVASSSVFPTAGYANPTLTILALALRLADHLRGQLPA